jgi:hypothetical protein
MRDPSRFSRRTLIEAAKTLGYLDHADFDFVMLRLSVEDHITHGPSLSKPNKVNQLIRFAVGNPGYETENGTNLWDAVVETASNRPNVKFHTDFMRALVRDGFTLTEEGELRRTLPEVADLPQADDEVHALLDELGMATAKGHLDLAIDNHARGQWAPANGELRKVIENMFDEIAERLDPERAAATPKGNARRQLLADLDPPFLKELLGEWSNGSEQGKNFVNGVFKRLHREGGHPGLSDEEDCTFRLHLVLIVARLFLRRARSLAAAL